MKKFSKIIFRIYLAAIGLLIVALIFFVVAWFLADLKAREAKPRLDQAAALFSQTVSIKPEDQVRPCLYNQETIIISLNHRYYFSVKAGQVKLLNVMHQRDSEAYPQMLRDGEFMDLYWILENCR